MQTTRKYVRRTVIAVLLSSVFVYSAMLVFVYFFPPRYSNCQRYADDLNGGLKEIGGRKYNIKMCGTGGDDNSNQDEIELEISNEQGEILAKRHFTVHRMANFYEPLEYRNDHIIYYDFSTHNNFKKRINMPPTAIDWILARLPFLN